MTKLADLIEKYCDHLLSDSYSLAPHVKAEIAEWENTLMKKGDIKEVIFGDNGVMQFEFLPDDDRDEIDQKLAAHRESYAPEGKSPVLFAKEMAAWAKDLFEREQEKKRWKYRQAVARTLDNYSPIRSLIIQNIAYILDEFDTDIANTVLSIGMKDRSGDVCLQLRIDDDCFCVIAGQDGRTVLEFERALEAAEAYREQFKIIFGVEV